MSVAPRRFAYVFAALAPLALAGTSRADDPAQPPVIAPPPALPSGSAVFVGTDEIADPREMLKILKTQLERLQTPQPSLPQHRDLHDAWDSILRPRIGRMLSRLQTWSESQHWSQVEAKGGEGQKDYFVLRVADWEAFTRDAAGLATELGGALKQYQNVKVERKLDQRDSPQLVPGPSPEFSFAYPSTVLYRGILDRQAAIPQLGFRQRGSYWRLFGHFNDAWNYWWLGTSKWWKYWEHRQESDRVTEELNGMLNATRETLASTLLGLQVFVGAVQGAEEERLQSLCLACSTDDATLREMAQTALRDMTPVRLEAERFQGEGYAKYGSLLRAWLRRHDAAVRVLDVTAKRMDDTEPVPPAPEKPTVPPPAADLRDLPPERPPLPGAWDRGARMDSAEPVDKVFSGKRKDERLVCAVDVLLHSGRRRFEGTTVDLSRSGVQVRVPFKSFTTAMSGQRVGTAINAADRHFGGGFHVEFPGRGDPIPVVLVRMVVEVDEPDGLRLGCEFRVPLSAEAVKRVTTPVKKGR